MMFLSGADRGWGKRELAAWLVGPYQTIVARMTDADAAPSSGAPISIGPIREGSVEELVDLVRVGVASTLAELRRAETVSITQAIRSQTVMWAQSAKGLMWVPVDRPRMRLEARVLSVFAVDYLLRPEPYETELSVCPSCDLVAFEGADADCARCGALGRPSHIHGLAPLAGAAKG